MLVALLFAAMSASQQQPSVEIPYKGLSYSMLSRGGVTIMAAPLNRPILEYSTVQVWISNGSKQPVRVSPQSFEVRFGSQAMIPGTSENEVLAEIQQRATHKDLSELVTAYETVLLGFANEKSMGYYQQRKHAAQSSMSGGGKLRATATAAAIILPDRVLKPGEAIDGTVFFRGDSKVGRIAFIGAHIAGATYDFPQSAPVEEHVHP